MKGKAADISKSIGLVRRLVAYQPPVNIEIVLLDYMHDLQAEIDRRAARAGRQRVIARFTNTELVFSIEGATQLAALCSRPRVAHVLTEYITSLAEELDGRTPKRAASRTNSRENRKDDVAHDE